MTKLAFKRMALAFVELLKEAGPSVNTLAPVNNALKSIKPPKMNAGLQIKPPSLGPKSAVGATNLKIKVPKPGKAPSIKPPAAAPALSTGIKLRPGNPVT